MTFNMLNSNENGKLLLKCAASKLNTERRRGDGGGKAFPLLLLSFGGGISPKHSTPSFILPHKRGTDGFGTFGKN